MILPFFGFGGGCGGGAVCLGSKLRTATKVGPSTISSAPAADRRGNWPMTFQITAAVQCIGKITLPPFLPKKKNPVPPSTRNMRGLPAGLTVRR